MTEIPEDYWHELFILSALLRVWQKDSEWLEKDLRNQLKRQILDSCIIVGNLVSAK